MKGYGQFCPISKAAEILAERWTFLVIRELLLGSRRYGDIQRGVPRMSPALLAKRLKQLEHAGIVVRAQKRGGAAIEYRLTDAGLDLESLIDRLAEWGYRWASQTLLREDLDPGFLMWAIRRNLVADALPAARTVIHVEFSDGRPPHRWWLIVADSDVDLCIKDPGFEVDLLIRTDVLTLTRLFECRISLAEARSSRHMTLQGSTLLIRTMKDWFGRPASQWVQ